MPPKRRGKKKAAAPPAKPNPVPWDEHHPARILLYEELRSGNISPTMKPKDVYVKYCHTKAFNTWGMEYNANFGTRFNGLKEIVLESNRRRDEDAADFKMFRELHPRPPVDRRGDPFWDGSQAQERLKRDLDNPEFSNMKPSKLWESRELYQQWSLSVFRGHIHQERDTRKYLYTLRFRADELAEKRKKTRLTLEEKAIRYSKHVDRDSSSSSTEE